MKSEKTTDPVPKTCMVADCAALAEDEVSAGGESWAVCADHAKCIGVFRRDIDNDEWSKCSDASNREDFASELKEELMATIGGLEIEVAKLKDEVLGLEHRIQQLEQANEQ